MDANINTTALDNMYSEIDKCKYSLDQIVTTIKNEFRISANMLEGEQFEKFKYQAEISCRTLVDVCDSLMKIKEYMKRLQTEVENYDRTRFGG